MKKLANGILIGIMVGLALAIPVAVYMALDTILYAVKITVIFIAAVALLILAYIGFIRWQNERHQQYRVIDGSFPLQRHKLPTGDWIVVDPNKVPGAAYVIGPSVGYREVESSVGAQVQMVIDQAVQQTRSLAAVAVGDHAFVRTKGMIAQPKLPSSITKMMPKPAKREPDLPALPAPADDPTPPVARIDATTALAQSTGSRWILGQADDGATLAFEPARHFSLGILGSTGTGKTSSIGFAAALAALRAGWHVAVINPDGNRRPPDGGPGWYMLESHIELHDTDPMTFPSQVETVYNFFERRATLANPRPVLVIFEEYGDINRHLRKRSKADADAVDVMLDTILTRGRKHSVHTAFIDQYPEHWSNAVLGGTKLKTVFQLGPGQGSKVEEYKAGQLPPMGRFLTRGVEYASFDTSVAVPALLRQLPTPDKARRIINGSATVVPQPAPALSVDRSVDRSATPSVSALQGEARPSPAPPNAPNERSEETRQAIFAHLDANPKATQADIRRLLKTSNGYTHECWHAWHKAQKASAEPAPVEPVETQQTTVPPATVPDAIYGWREVVESDNPASVEQMEAIRQAIASGKISVG